MSLGQALALRQIPPARRAYNPGRTLVLGWYVARHDEDRYDEVTEYRVALFDAKTGEELMFLATSVHERADTGAKKGEHLASAAFDAADEDVIVMRFVDGKEERRRVDEDFEALEHDPEDSGVEVSDAERRVRDRMRQDAERLKRKLKRARARKPEAP